MSRLAFLLALLLCGCGRLQPLPVPVPPAPEPDVVLPVPAGPLRVVIWRETDLARVPEGQLQQFFGPELHAWFKAHGIGYRIWDQNISTTSLTAPEWRAAAEVRPKQVPWIVATNGRKTVEGALPGTAAETIKLLEPLLP